MHSNFMQKQWLHKPYLEVWPPAKFLCSEETDGRRSLATAVPKTNPRTGRCSGRVSTPCGTQRKSHRHHQRTCRFEKSGRRNAMRGHLHARCRACNDLRKEKYTHSTYIRRAVQHHGRVSSSMPRTCRPIAGEAVFCSSGAGEASLGGIHAPALFRPFSAAELKRPYFTLTWGEGHV